MLLLFLACREATVPVPPEQPPLAFTEAPAVAPNPQAARLVAVLTAQTSRPTSIAVAVSDGGRTWVHAGEGLATEHEVRILGLRADTLHVLDVTATDAEGHEVAASLSYETGPLPDDLPLPTVTSEPQRMEPGLTLLELGGYLVMVDAEGTVRWLFDGVLHAGEATITERGTLLAQSGKNRIEEYELDGQLVASWHATGRPAPDGSIPVDVEALHHDVYELPSGNLLALSIERRRIEGYPSSEVNPHAPPQDAWVAGDVVVELQRDGTVVNRWPLLDVLDPLRVGYHAVRGNHWEDFYGGDDVKDWSHGNAVFYDAARDEIVVSLRHQDAVVALEYPTGALSWIVAPEANWRPPWDGYLLRPATPELVPPYHQHGAKITPDGALMLFDNGNGRASAFEPGADGVTSRGVELLLDHDAGTWTLGWSATTSPPVFSSSLGDCDPLPGTGNVLVTFGNVDEVEEHGVRVIEATRDEPPEIVFDLRVAQPSTTFRAQRVTGVVPGF